MFFRAQTLLLPLLLLVSIQVHAHAHTHEHVHDDAHVHNHEHHENHTSKHKCGAQPLTEEEKERTYDTFLEYKRKNPKEVKQNYEFDVYWHIIQHSDGSGEVTDEQINISMDLLNQGFSGNLIHASKDCFGNTVSGIETSIRFVLRGVDRTVNDNWFGVSVEDDVSGIVESLHVGDCTAMNVYTTLLTDVGGFANVPYTCYYYGTLSDGVFVGHNNLPTYLDDDDDEAQRGDLLIHEAGHWVGLDHTFQGGCSEVNDNVADTPPQETVFSCPIGSDTCPGGGVDSIHNYMAYTDDCCMYRFTQGQITYAHSQLDAYRLTPNNNPETFDNYYDYFCLKRFAKKLFAD